MRKDLPFTAKWIFVVEIRQKMCLDECRKSSSRGRQCDWISSTVSSTEWLKHTSQIRIITQAPLATAMFRNGFSLSCELAILLPIVTGSSFADWSCVLEVLSEVFKAPLRHIWFPRHHKCPDQSVIHHSWCPKWGKIDTCYVYDSSGNSSVGVTFQDCNIDAEAYVLQIRHQRVFQYLVSTAQPHKRTLFFCSPLPYNLIRPQHICFIGRGRSNRKMSRGFELYT